MQYIHGATVRDRAARPPLAVTWQVAADHYARWVNDAHEDHRYYRPRALPHATHEPAADCRALLALIETMASENIRARRNQFTASRERYIVAAIQACDAEEAAGGRLMADQLTGNIALVTGAGSGIGRASALAFARAGAKVVVADVDAHGGAETVQRIEQSGGAAIFVAADVSRGGDVRHMVDQTVRTYGRLDCAHNNAGIATSGLTHEIAEVRGLGYSPST